MLSNLTLMKDELLLAGAVAVSVGSFGYFAVPWQGLLIGPADEAAEYYVQLEKANQEYFDRYGLWPNDVTTNNPTDNAVVLMSREPLTMAYRESLVYQPVMKGLLESTPTGLVAKHTYGNGGRVEIVPLNGGAYRYSITFSNLSLDQAKALDEKIDGEFSPGKGRLRLSEEDGVMTARYLANPRDDSLAAK